MTQIVEPRFPGKVTTEHLAKWVYVYIRQSSTIQVTRNAESTDMQYRLVERGIQLGWPRDRIRIIDEDLGKSGATKEYRFGFQHLLSEIALGQVGLVISLDASRLARNNLDWHQLLELCSMFGTLIADGESLYDPRNYSDRLLLGLSGMMSEAELHQLKLRLQAGARNKAERGELKLHLPAGLERTRENEVILHPDEEIQARIRLVFDKFRELKSARAVSLYLQKQKLMLPSRLLRGPAPHDIVWYPTRYSGVLNILKNPAYAGVYGYGQTVRDPTRRKPGHSFSGLVQQPIDKWIAVIHNVYPAYISWEEFLANQAQLRDNQNRYKEDRHGVPRKGSALLQGIITCGRCGAHMRVRYTGSSGQYPVYECGTPQLEHGCAYCQEVRALGLDAEIKRLVFDALEPDKLDIALAALDQVELEHKTLCQQWELRLQRVRYEADRAQRQYNAVEPENRLVARNLERQWEEKLRAVEQISQEYAVWRQQNRLNLTEIDRDEILSLGQDLPRVWNATSTTDADRKHILRLVIREVIVDQHRGRGRIWFQINWQTGAISDHWFNRPVLSYAEHADYERLKNRIRELWEEQKLDDDIAEILNQEGFRTARGSTLSIGTVWTIRNRHMGLPTHKNVGTVPERWDDGTYSVQGAAKILGVIPETIRKWIKTGRIQGRQLAKGTAWKVSLSDTQIVELKDYAQRARRTSRRVP